jgi:transposase
MKFVATKTADQLDLQALHRVRERLVGQRTGVINQIRAFLLERGVAVRQGRRFLCTELPIILGERCDVPSPRMMRIIEELTGDWHRLDERIEGLSAEITALARQDAACERLMTVARHRTDHLERNGCSDRQWRGVLEGAQLRRLARTGCPGRFRLETARTLARYRSRQSLFARPVRAGGLGRVGQDNGLGPLRAQSLD